MKTTWLPLCAALACAGAPSKPLPAHYAAKSAEHPKYPRARYLTGVGVSALSAEDAGARAQGDVAAQISSQIETELVSFEQFTTRGGSTQEVRSNARVRADFKRNDLIRVVESEQNGGTFYAFAVLDRAQAAQELSTGMTASLASFKAAAEAARAADAEQKTGVFATASAEAARLRQGLDADFVRRRAIAGRPAPEEPDYVKLRNDLLTLREQHLARRVVGIVVKAGGRGHLNDYAVNAVKRIGLRPDGVTCDKRHKSDATDATELEVAPDEKCGESSLGERCEVTVRLVARACAGDTSGAGTVPTVRGIHPSDPEKAKKSAWDKVTPAAIETAVREALKSAIELGDER